MIDTWLAKKDVVRISDGILLYHKTDEILPFVKTWMDLENIILNEISQRKKLRIMWFHSYVGYTAESNKWTKKDKQGLTDTVNSMLVPRGKEEWGLTEG